MPPESPLSGNAVSPPDAEFSVTGTPGRLDAALRTALDLSLRAARRLCGDGRVRVNGKRARAGSPVVPGDRVSLLPPGKADEETVPPGCRLLGTDRGFALLAKPAGLHTAALAGRATPSLEALLPHLFAGHDVDPGQILLLQRLDFGTSGLVTAALTPEAARAFREEERAGGVRKGYLCLLEGRLPEETVSRRRLVSDGGRGMRALAEDDPDPVRATRLRPLAWTDSREIFGGEDGAPARPLTLAACEIRRGQRHQIRVHASALGHPLAGDGLYGGLPLPGGRFFLHHARLDSAPVSGRLAPDWPLQGELVRSVTLWLESQA